MSFQKLAKLSARYHRGFTNNRHQQSTRNFCISTRWPTLIQYIVYFSSSGLPQWSRGYHTRHWIRGSRVQTRPGSINFLTVQKFWIWVPHGRLARWMKWRACEVGEEKEDLENELWRRWSNGRVWEWACDVGKATEGLENELWCRWSNRRVGEWAVT